MPPFTCIVSPVIYEAKSEHKNAVEFATSSPVPSFDMGILDNSVVLISSDIF